MVLLYILAGEMLTSTRLVVCSFGGVASANASSIKQNLEKQNLHLETFEIFFPVTREMALFMLIHDTVNEMGCKHVSTIELYMRTAADCNNQNADQIDSARTEGEEVVIPTTF
ncbi:hypothetical protein C5167_007144 [Papaver somniferum]|uniref:Uncharacterized protein n=1 Tax=Papaver somniferum TaxID=3469 RepID=A0A4Y7JJA6_PAPSO|nr:hypothetical protein C5167_007144 [Papaver somniferum]